MRVYIAGPITGLTESEYTTNFGLAEAKLIDMEHEPVNPLKTFPECGEFCQTPDMVVGGQSIAFDDGSYMHSWACYMKYDLIEMLGCDGITVLPGYHNSRGATIEYELAISLGYTRVYLNEE